MWRASLPCLAALALAAVLGQGRWLALFALAALTHEGGHLLLLSLWGAKIEAVGFRLSGAEIRYAGNRLSYGQEAAAALAGPGANLLGACLCAGLARLWPAAFLYQLAGCHLVLACFNLLPALPLDGGRVLRAALEWRFPLRGERAAGWVSLCAGAALAAAGAVLLARGGNLTLLTAGGVILLGQYQTLRRRSG